MSELLDNKFKTQLKAFFEDELYGDDFLLNQIDTCETNKDLKNFFINNGEHIAGMIDVDLEPNCYDCDVKDREIEELEDTIDELESEPDTLNEVYKYEAFMMYKDTFSTPEFEELMKRNTKE